MPRSGQLRRILSCITLLAVKYAALLTGRRRSLNDVEAYRVARHL